MRVILPTDLQVYGPTFFMRVILPVLTYKFLQDNRNFGGKITTVSKYQTKILSSRILCWFLG